MTKLCVRCGMVKPLADFGTNRAKPDGVQSSCTPCRKRINAESYLRTKSRHNGKRKAQAQAHKQANREYVLDYLRSHPCVDCGEADPIVLQFDHQHDKTDNVATLIQTSSVARITEEIAKCEVVCANCHTRRTARQFGWWKASVAELV